jgi:hypothetical protein
MSDENEYRKILAPIEDAIDNINQKRTSLIIHVLVAALQQHHVQSLDDYGTNQQEQTQARIETACTDIMDKMMQLIQLMRKLPEDDELRPIYGRKLLDLSSRFKSMQQEHKINSELSNTSIIHTLDHQLQK